MTEEEIENLKSRIDKNKRILDMIVDYMGEYECNEIFTNEEAMERINKIIEAKK